jgi:hypothetical protein
MRIACAWLNAELISSTSALGRGESQSPNLFQETRPETLSEKGVRLA